MKSEEKDTPPSTTHHTPSLAMDIRMKNEHVGDIFISNESWTMGYLIKEAMRPHVDYVGCTRMHPPEILRLHMCVRLKTGGDQDEMRGVLSRSIEDCKKSLADLSATFDRALEV